MNERRKRPSFHLLERCRERSEAVRPIGRRSWSSCYGSGERRNRVQSLTFFLTDSSGERLTTYYVTEFNQGKWHSPQNRQRIGFDPLFPEKVSYKSSNIFTRVQSGSVIHKVRSGSGSFLPSLFQFRSGFHEVAPERWRGTLISFILSRVFTVKGEEKSESKKVARL